MSVESQVVKQQFLLTTESLTMAETKVGFKDSGYDLKDLIGKGAFGSVWKADDPNNVEVAVKVIDRRCVYYRSSAKT